MVKFELPDPGEGLVEAEITQWLVHPGDLVKVNDPLVEIETAKSLVELPSPVSGRVQQLLASEGETVEVGSVIVLLAEDADQTGYASTPASVPDQTATAASGQTTTDELDPDEPMLVGYGPSSQAISRRPRKVSATSAAAGVPLASAAAHATAPEAAGYVVTTARAKPLVRRLARDLGVDLDAISGSGLDGIVTKEDVLAMARLDAAAAFGHQSGVAAARLTGRTPDRTEPIRGVRKTTAARLLASVQRHVHVTEWLSVDITETMALIERLKARRDLAGVRITPLTMVARTVCQVLPQHPLLNASWLPEQGVIGYHDDVDLGIAAATPRGLMVPAIRGAHRLSLVELAEALSGLTQRAKAGELRTAELSGGTFTITNVGIFGVDAGTPVINGLESAILCLGSIDRRPWVVGTGAAEHLEPRWVTTLMLSFDHQLIDGEQGSKFLAAVAGVLADPASAVVY